MANLVGALGGNKPNNGGLAKRRACGTCWTWWRRVVWWAAARTCWAGGLGQSARFARLAVQCRTCTALDVQGRGRAMDLVDLGAVAQGLHSAGVGVFGAGYSSAGIAGTRGEAGGGGGKVVFSQAAWALGRGFTVV